MTGGALAASSASVRPRPIPHSSRVTTPAAHASRLVDPGDLAAARTSIELFAGAGGLALGLQQARFRHIALNELDNRARNTLWANWGTGKSRTATDWFLEGDVAAQTWSRYASRATLVAGGAPCQPFSVGGVHRGDEDPRNLWPAFIDVVRQVGPLAVIGENVRGLTRASFLPSSTTSAIV